jgi:phosphatidylserine decarboxylase
VRRKPRQRPPIEDQLRERWLGAINEYGADVVLRDASEAFALRFGCDLSEGRAIALRAWRTLALPGSPT